MNRRLLLVYIYKDTHERDLKNLFFDSRHSFLPLFTDTIDSSVEYYAENRIACKLCDNFRCHKRDIRYRLFRILRNQSDQKQRIFEFQKTTCRFINLDFKFFP